MRFSKMLISLIVATTTVIPLAMAGEADQKSGAIWPDNSRDELTHEQIAVGLRLAGNKMYSVLDNDKCKGGVRDAWKYCIIGDYRFSQDTHYAATGYLQSPKDPDAYSPVLIINSSNVYLNSNLDPKQARAISVDFAETILNRKLNEIDPKDPDTFFDPRDLDLMNLYFRATQKVQGALADEACSSKEQASYLNGEQTPCTFGRFFVRKDGEYDYTILTRHGDEAVVSGYFGGGSLLMDATASDAEKIEQALEFIEATLNIKRETIIGIPLRIKNAQADARFASVTKRITDFAKERKCDYDASTDYLKGIPTNCEVGGYFFDRLDDGGYQVRMRNEPNTTNVALWIKDGKPFIRFHDLADQPYLDTSKVVPELDGAFVKLEQATAR
ncbi:hypothetical protein [Rhizobium sp. MHM7A]|uniref:hypothetical protein n=1 Tax=Rhizobium sp. MHM7A TaxID=2583233 RepID=UPI0011073FD7|nr:hypothetical protein [Rhizobium sp. MHM7A]TLX15978.1 hypothetical protein FFR93_01285 [Rhizobium sp. MHM7A]